MQAAERAPMVTGTDAPDARTKPHIRLSVIIGLTFATLLLVILTAGVQLVWARQHITTGAHDLTTAITTVRSPKRLEDPASRFYATGYLVSARNDFNAARNDLEFWSPALSTLGWVPHVGSQLVSASPASSAAYFASSSALDIVTGAGPLWPLLGPGGHQESLLGRFANALGPGQHDFENAAVAAQQGMDAVQDIPTNPGSQSLDKAVTKLRHDLPRLRATGLWLAVMPALLGEGVPQKYLFVWENSDEIRATGGFIGAVDLVKVNRGKMTRHFSGSALGNEINVPEVPVPEAVLTNETSWIFRDSNFSPDFPTSARLERWFYARDTGTNVNGVVDFVDRGVSDLLKATGPIYLPQYRVTVTAANAQELANHYASATTGGYRGPLSSSQLRNKDTYRKQFLGVEFSALIKRLQNLPASRWGALGNAVAYAIQRHDILVWNQHAKIERAVEASGASGELRRANGDFLYIVDDNRSYNKIAPYVHEWASYSVDILPSLWLDSTVTIHYHLNPSPPGIEGNGPRYGQAGSKHDFRDFLRVLVPTGATVQVPSGLSLLSPNIAQPAYDVTQIGGWFQMRPNQNRTVKIEYQVPANDLSFGNFRHYQLTVPRQPGTQLSGVAVTVHGLDGIGLSGAGSNNAKRYRVWLALSHDQHVSLGIVGRESPSQIKLPAAHWQDPYVQWSYFRGL